MTEQNYGDIPVAGSAKAYSRVPRCYRLDTGEEISRQVWYLNRDRTPPRAVIETGRGLERVDVRIEYYQKQLVEMGEPAPSVATTPEETPDASDVEPT